jgi:membrane peptidoglycan carboxypeptidase
VIFVPGHGGCGRSSEDSVDSRFIGFTNDVTIAVWVGYDNSDGKRKSQAQHFPRLSQLLGRSVRKYVSEVANATGSMMLQPPFLRDGASVLVVDDASAARTGARRRGALTGQLKGK